MANTNSPNMADLNASPARLAAAKHSGSIVWEIGTTEFTPTAADTLLIARVPTTAVLHDFEFAFDDNGGTITMDCGFFEIGNPGTVVDQNALVTLLDTSTAALAMASLRYETQPIETTGERMWELANLAAEPAFSQMDIGWTVVTGTTPAAGSVAWRISYTV